MNKSLSTLATLEALGRQLEEIRVPLECAAYKADALRHLGRLEGALQSDPPIPPTDYNALYADKFIRDVPLQRCLHNRNQP